MQGKSLIRNIFIVLLVAWALYALWPTYQFNSLTENERIELDESGKLVELRSRAIRMGLDYRGECT